LHFAGNTPESSGVEGGTKTAAEERSGYVTHVTDLHPSDGRGVAEQVSIDASCGCELLVQRVARYAPGRSEPRSSGDHQEVLYVAEGRGTFLLGGREHPLEPDTGVFVVAGETYEIDNPGPDDLLLITVVAPQLAGHAAGERRAVRFREQPELPAGKDREFRYLVDKDVGCRDVTQFVGEIPPGRSPMHSHTYDEVVYVVEGQGVLHLGGERTPIAAGTCIHLPPLVEHCLENTGANKMRVLGVFYPQGDPASRAYEATEAHGAT
jgi:mannose-6-phosphate isomerase-like protein (cupin superfamily)